MSDEADTRGVEAEDPDEVKSRVVRILASMLQAFVDAPTAAATARVGFDTADNILEELDYFAKVARIDAEVLKSQEAERERDQWIEAAKYEKAHGEKMQRASNADRIEVQRLRAALERIAAESEENLPGHFLARLIDINTWAKDALDPTRLTECHCKSYYERTGEHAQGCPLAAAALHREGDEK